MENKFPIVKFEYTDENGYRTALEIEQEYFDSLGETELSHLFAVFNKFLQAAGFSRENEYIFEESLTGDEYVYLSEQLEDYRKGNRQDE